MQKTKFYTGVGDGGRSKMGHKSLSKDSPAFWVLGNLDELNSWIGFCKSAVDPLSEIKEVSALLKEIQESLFIIQAEIAAAASEVQSSIAIGQDKIEHMEQEISKIDSILPPITKFIIAGGSEASARLDVARTIARRVERATKEYSYNNQVKSEILQYMNRLSSFLFALARFVNYKLDIKEENPSYK